MSVSVRNTSRKQPTHDYLKYWRVIKYWAKRKYNISYSCKNIWYKVYHFIYIEIFIYINIKKVNKFHNI